MSAKLQNKNTVEFNYTFFHQDGTTPRDLSAYDTVTLLLHPPSGATDPIVVTAGCSFVDATLGTVTCSSYQVLIPGDGWQAQFVCSLGAYTDTNLNSNYGERTDMPPVLPNLDDV